MNTHQSNKTYLPTRHFCSKAKIRVLSIAFLLCLGGSAWAEPLSFNLNLPDLFTLLKSRLISPDQREVTPRLTPPTPQPVGPPGVEVDPNARPKDGIRPRFGFPR